MNYLGLTCCVFMLLLSSKALYASNVKAYYGQYDASKKEIGLPAKSLNPPIIEPWLEAIPATQPYQIDILVPQLIDTWLAFSYGALKEAKRLGIEANLYSSGSYLNFGNQREQLENALTNGSHGVVLSSISYNKMDKTVEKVSQSGRPVIAMANDILAPSISGKSLVSFLDMGYLIGQYVINKEKSNPSNKPISVAFFPGPKGAGWSADSLKGFQQALQENTNKLQIEIVNQDILMWGDTRDIMQRRLVNLVLEKHPNISYLIGNAVAANIAVNIKEKHPQYPQLKILSTYINPKVYQHIQKKNILAAACDFPVQQGKYAVAMLKNELERKGSNSKFPFRISPIIEMITPQNIDQYPFKSIFGEPSYIKNLNLH